MRWLRERGLTLVLMATFVACLAGQVWAGLYDDNDERVAHGQPPQGLNEYVRSGHFYEALFENWESEFLQMAVFVLLTTVLVQKGSPESRRLGVRELVDDDPRDFRDAPDAPWPVRRGGWMLWLYERSLGTAFILLFVGSWIGHAAGGFAEYASEQQWHGQPRPGLAEYAMSSRLWFESLQNWQSEFLSVAAMVWLSVYLRQRGSPESKPVHAPHSETGH